MSLSLSEDWQALCGITSGSSLFAKYLFTGIQNEMGVTDYED